MVLTAVFLVPLAVGIYLSAGTNRRSAHATQVSRDLASMYAQGVDFSKQANQNIALRLLNPSDGKSVLILSRIRMVTAADCAAVGSAPCTNLGFPVMVQRIVIGDLDLHPSTLGSPLSVDATTGAILSWATDTSARVTDPGVSVKPGEPAYAAEAFISDPEDHTGVYARTLF
jgi:hypothetical protein